MRRARTSTCRGRARGNRTTTCTSRSASRSTISRRLRRSTCARYPPPPPHCTAAPPPLTAPRALLRRRSRGRRTRWSSKTGVFDATLVEKTGFSGAARPDGRARRGAAERRQPRHLPADGHRHARQVPRRSSARTRRRRRRRRRTPPTATSAADVRARELVGGGRAGADPPRALGRRPTASSRSTWYNEKLEVTTNGHNAMPVGTVIKGGDTVARLKLGLREELRIPTDSDGADVLLFEHPQARGETTGPAHRLPRASRRRARAQPSAPTRPSPPPTARRRRRRRRRRGSRRIEQT